MVDPDHTRLSLVRQCRLVSIARSSFYYEGALLHESSRARTMLTDRILTCRCDTTLVGRERSSD